ESDTPPTHDFYSILNSRLLLKKSAMDISFTLGFTKEAENVKILSAGLRMVFDPIKSPHYKLVDAGRISCDIDIQIYSSELDIEDHEHPIITTIQIPQRGMNFLESYSYMDPMLILIQIPHLLHLKWKLFESRGCLLLVCRDDIGSGEFTSYEMMKWMVDSVHCLEHCFGRKGKGFFVVDDNHDDDDNELLQQFEAEHNVYEFLPSFASVVGARCFYLDLGARCFDLLDGTTRVVQIAAFQELDPGLPL
ncbi:hypothetical protein Tco_1139754, partial [Tanacetum coccineum]